MANPPFIVPTRQSYGRAQIAARPHKADGKQMIRSEGEAIQARAGSYYQIGHVGSVKQHRDEQTITAAWDKLNRMMEEGKLPPPAANYTLEEIRYNPRFMGLNGDTKSVLAVEQVPSGPDSGTIIAFAPAAETLEHAVRCLAHELFRFHPTQGENHDLCYQYAQAAVRVFNGGKYNGPRVEVEEEPTEQAERDHVEGPIQVASLTPTDVPNTADAIEKTADNSGKEAPTDEPSYPELLADEISSALNVSNSDLSIEQRLEIAERNVRKRIALFSAGGLTEAAKHLNHYLEGKGADLIVPAKQYRTIPFVQNAERELMQRWEKAVIGAKPYEGEKQYWTFTDISHARGRSVESGITRRDWFQIEIEQKDALEISQDFALSWGKSHVRAMAADGLNIRLGGDLVVVSGTITFGAQDPYDFVYSQPGSFDGTLLELHDMAEPFSMIVKWEREFEAVFELRKAPARSWQKNGGSPAAPDTIVYSWSDPKLDGPLSPNQDYRKSIR